MARLRMLVTIFVGLCWIQSALSVSVLNKHFILSNTEPENEIADILYSKGYFPNERDLPKTSLVKDMDSDVTYLLSKLSDEDLIKLLNGQPKKAEYDLNDLAKIALNSKYVSNNIFKYDKFRNKKLDAPDTYNNDENNYYRHDVDREKAHAAFFKLDNKPVDPFSIKSESNPNYNALQKLNNLLYSYPQEQESENQSADDLEKKELLFGVLVSQLKALCCKSNKSSLKGKARAYYKHKQIYKSPNEYIFLIVNDEIKSNDSEELISVDPDSLEKNSSVLLLGPITTPLSDEQLKLVINRITKELSKPEFLPLLQQLGEGTLSEKNIKLTKSLLSGPETRRYVKPHRCNHQSKLARVYGGPKWLICTGYLNLNVPSLYD